MRFPNTARNASSCLYKECLAKTLCTKTFLSAFGTISNCGTRNTIDFIPIIIRITLLARRLIFYDLTYAAVFEYFHALYTMSLSSIPKVCGAAVADSGTCIQCIVYIVDAGGTIFLVQSFAFIASSFTTVDHGE
jgi:hypothetical protein